MNSLLGWLRPEVLAALGLFSAAFLALGVLAIPALAVRIPRDYFAGPAPPPSRFRARNPVISLVLDGVRNLVGGVLVLAGIAMLFLPGQGLLTILIGLMVAQFPGKRRCEMAVLRAPGVLRGLNWLRQRAGRLPLDVWESQSD